jgi:hypothetical protein
MFETHRFDGTPVVFSRNLINLDDFLEALRINRSRYQEIIKRHDESLSIASEELRITDSSKELGATGSIDDLSTIPFGREKRVWVGDRRRKFIDLRQVVICVQQAIELGNINRHEGFEFLQWCVRIVDQGIEQLCHEESEESLQHSLTILAAYGRITLRPEFTVLDLPDSDKKTRRFDLVEYDNPRHNVRSGSA